MNSDTRRFIRYVKTHCRGQENSRHGDEIAEVLELPNARAVRDCMEAANEAGELIGAVPSKGYWWIVSAEDGEHAVLHNYAQGNKHLKNARNLEEAVLRAYGPPQLFSEKANA